MASARNTPQQERSRVAVSRVLDAADALFGEFGVHETQISQIIEQSGVSAGSLYRFFPDKMSIAAALVERHREGINGLGGELMRAKTIDEVLVLIDLAVDFSASHRAANPGYRALTVVFPATDPESPLAQMREDQVNLFVELVADVASHIPAEERRRVVSYMAIILDAVLNAQEVEEDPAARAAEAKLVLRRYVGEMLRQS